MTQVFVSVNTAFDGTSLATVCPLTVAASPAVVAYLTDLLASAVLSTFPNPTSLLVTLWGLPLVFWLCVYAVFP